MSGDLLCLSHLRWGFVYQRPNHLMSRFARQRRVFFVEEPIFDATEPRLDVAVAASGVRVAVPHLPAGSSGPEIERMQRVLLDELRARERMIEPLLWMYTPMALGFARHVRAAATIYDCMDELSAFRGAPPELRERERELFTLADLVFTGGHALWEAKRQHHPSIHAFPSSVDAGHFERARTLGPEDEPADQRTIPRPRLGFSGVVDERFDVGLLRDVAKARPGWQFVIVGPTVKIDPATLPRGPNVHYLGPRPYDELPGYLAGWDVATMPFAQNEATRFISPTKTLEYLAAGRPVVSTPVRDVVRPYGERGLVRIAHGAAAFIAAVEAALAERGTTAERDRRAACDSFVAQTSWDRTWAQMEALVSGVLGRRAGRADMEKEPCLII